MAKRKKKPTPKKVTAQVHVVEAPKEVALEVVLPAPVVKTWQATGKRLIIRVKRFVLKNL
jgi:hypothetical protein